MLIMLADFAGILISAFLIIGTAAKIHDCKNEDLVLLNAVDYAVGKTVYETAPDTFFYDWPRSWVGCNIKETIYISPA